MKINLDTITEEQLETLLPTDRLKSMFYELRKYANAEIGLYEITQYMKRKKFNFSTNKAGLGKVQYFVTDIGGDKFIFEY